MVLSCMKYWKRTTRLTMLELCVLTTLTVSHYPILLLLFVKKKKILFPSYSVNSLKIRVSSLVWLRKGGRGVWRLTEESEHRWYFLACRRIQSCLKLFVLTSLAVSR
jgi:hypothetical protein